MQIIDTKNIFIHWSFNYICWVPATYQVLRVLGNRQIRNPLHFFWEGCLKHWETLPVTKDLLYLPPGEIDTLVVKLPSKIAEIMISLLRYNDFLPNSLKIQSCPCQKKATYNFTFCVHMLCYFIKHFTFWSVKRLIL